jgi:hypothetical protein
LSRLLPALRGRLPRAQIDGTVERKIPRLHDSILPYPGRCLIPAPGRAGRSSGESFTDTVASLVLRLRDG